MLTSIQWSHFLKMQICNLEVLFDLVWCLNAQVAARKVKNASVVLRFVGQVRLFFRKADIVISNHNETRLLYRCCITQHKSVIQKTFGSFSCTSIASDAYTVFKLHPLSSSFWSLLQIMESVGMFC